MDVTTLSPGQRKAYNLGFLLLLIVLPALTWYMSICVLHYDGALFFGTSGAAWAEFWGHVEPPNATTVGLYVAWFVLQAVLMQVLPGRLEKGVALESGERLTYKLNGLVAEVLSLGLALALVYGGALSPTVIFDEYGSFVTT